MKYLAIDIGASSGRFLLGEIINGKIELTEVCRFPNGMIKKEDKLVWDTEALFGHIKNGLRACSDAGLVPDYLGIDTWGVDFVLLDKNDKMIGDAVGYRDSRVDGMDEPVYAIIPEKELYRRTGIQKNSFNTIYQLEALKMKHPEELEAAETMLMTPEYLNFLLTGKKMAEYTIASTSGLLDAGKCDWDFDLIGKLGFPERIFGKLNMPGTTVGRLLPEVAAEVGMDVTVLLPATHDTGSAVLALPTNEENVIYISSGTWSLMGVERMTADTGEESFLCDFTNEGGYDRRYRYLKNIMGLWMIQSVRKELNAAGGNYSFADIERLASEAGRPDRLVDVNAKEFLAPESMTDAVRKAAGLTEKDSVGRLFAVIYYSLADKYRSEAEKLEKHLGKKIGTIHIIGGGSKDGLLNRLTAEMSGKKVIAGPTEATAIGNLTAQMLATGTFSSLSEARDCIAASFVGKEIG